MILVGYPPAEAEEAYFKCGKSLEKAIKKLHDDRAFNSRVIDSCLDLGHIGPQTGSDIFDFSKKMDVINRIECMFLPDTLEGIYTWDKT